MDESAANSPRTQLAQITLNDLEIAPIPVDQNIVMDRTSVTNDKAKRTLDAQPLEVNKILVDVVNRNFIRDAVALENSV